MVFSKKLILRMPIAAGTIARGNVERGTTLFAVGEA